MASRTRSWARGQRLRRRRGGWVAAEAIDPSYRREIACPKERWTARAQHYEVLETGGVLQAARNGGVQTRRATGRALRYRRGERGGRVALSRRASEVCKEALRIRFPTVAFPPDGRVLSVSPSLSRTPICGRSVLQLRASCTSSSPMCYVPSRLLRATFPPATRIVPLRLPAGALRELHSPARRLPPTPSKMSSNLPHPHHAPSLLTSPIFQHLGNGARCQLLNDAKISPLLAMNSAETPLPPSLRKATAVHLYSASLAGSS